LVEKTQEQRLNSSTAAQAEQQQRTRLATTRNSERERQQHRQPPQQHNTERHREQQPASSRATSLFSPACLPLYVLAFLKTRVSKRTTPEYQNNKK